MAVEPKTRQSILAAAKACLLDTGYSGVSTRGIAEEAGVPLSQIHYHFGSKQNLMLEVLEEENRQLVQRQSRMYEENAPLWKRWEQACDYLEDDLESGYVRVLQEMTAVGWTDEEVAAEVREDLRAWFDLLTDVAADTAERFGGLGPFTPEEIGVLTGVQFLGAETMILLGFEESKFPARSALRRVGELIRGLEESG